MKLITISLEALKLEGFLIWRLFSGFTCIIDEIKISIPDELYAPFQETIMSYDHMVVW